MHFNFVPVTSDGRLSAKSLFARKNLIEQQTAYFEAVGQRYGLMRGEGKEAGKRRWHMETPDYKAVIGAAVADADIVRAEAAQEIAELRQKATELRQEDETLIEGIKTHKEQESVLNSEITAKKRELRLLSSSKAKAVQATSLFGGKDVKLPKEDFEALRRTAGYVDAVIADTNEKIKAASGFKERFERLVGRLKKYILPKLPEPLKPLFESILRDEEPEKEGVIKWLEKYSKESQELERPTSPSEKKRDDRDR
jgi:chromosome segregation ATPase